MATKTYAVGLVFVKHNNNTLDDVFHFLEIINAENEQEALGQIMIKAKSEMKQAGVKGAVLSSFHTVEIKQNA